MIRPTAESALRAMVAIAQRAGDAVVTPTIAEITKVPPGYLPKVLQTLRKAGLVNSKRGLGGGFTLARPAEDLTVLEVGSAVDPIKRIHSCRLGIASLGTDPSPLHQRLQQSAATGGGPTRSTAWSSMTGTWRPEVTAEPLGPRVGAATRQWPRTRCRAPSKVSSR